MKANFKGSQTERNLMRSFAGESQARNRYTFFSGAARKEGLIQIALIFEETAAQEREHAKRLFDFMEGGDVEISDAYPGAKVGSTLENLKAAAVGEEHEWSNLYPGFAKVAHEEGFLQIAVAFERIAVAEKQHGKRFRELAANLETGRVFKRNETVTWRCLNCGYLHEAPEAPKLCPACLHPQSYFELLGENW